MLRWYLFFLLLLIGGTTGTAQKIQYDCRQCTLTTEDKWKIQKVAEYETAFFADVFGARRKQTIRIRFFGEEKKFKNAQRKSVGHIISETGVYAPSGRLVLVFKWTRFLATAYHECSHAIYHHHANIRPTWIDEGLAEYFKGAQIDSLDSITIREIAWRRDDMKKYVSDSSFTIRRTLRASHRKFHALHETRHYSTSWGIVYFLRTQHDEIFKLILYNVSAGIKSEKAIEDEYPGGVVQLEKDIRIFYE